MANTFKLASKASVTSNDVIFTCASGASAVLLGCIISNSTTGATTCTLTLSSTTSNRTNANNESNQPIEILTNAPLPVGSSLEVLAGNKIVLEEGDSISLAAAAASDIALSLMEIT